MYAANPHAIGEIILDDNEPAWPRMRGRKSICSYSTHSIEDSTHLAFYHDPEKPGTGILYASQHGSNVRYDVFARVLIHNSRKAVFVLDVDYTYDYLDLCNAEDDVIRTGKLRSWRRGDLFHMHVDFILGRFKNMVFGKDWNLYLGVTKRLIYKFEKKVKKMAQQVPTLKDVVDNHIVKHLMNLEIPWFHPTKESLMATYKVTPEDRKNVEDLFEIYVGKPSDSGSGVYHYWCKDVLTFIP
jgi:hypothetical protein